MALESSFFLRHLSSLKRRLYAAKPRQIPPIRRAKKRQTDSSRANSLFAPAPERKQKRAEPEHRRPLCRFRNGDIADQKSRVGRHAGKDVFDFLSVNGVFERFYRPLNSRRAGVSGGPRYDLQPLAYVLHDQFVKFGFRRGVKVHNERSASAYSARRQGYSVEIVAAFDAHNNLPAAVDANVAELVGGAYVAAGAKRCNRSGRGLVEYERPFGHVVANRAVADKFEVKLPIFTSGFSAFLPSPAAAK